MNRATYSTARYHDGVTWIARHEIADDLETLAQLPTVRLLAALFHRQPEHVAHAVAYEAYLLRARGRREATEQSG